MASINFYLKEPESTSDSIILLSYYNKNFRFKFSIGESIDPKKWNSQNQRAKRTFVGAQELNQFIESIEEVVQKFIRTTLSHGEELTSKAIRSHLKNFLNKTDKVVEPKFFESLTQYLKVKEGKLSFNYLRTVKTLQNHLLEFQTKEKYKIDFKNIDLAFYELYTSFLFKKGLTNNTVGVDISRLKRFLDWSQEMGYNSSTFYKNKSFKAIESETEMITLTEEELFKIYNLDLTKNKKLQNIRDSFCFGCFTGLRYSDIEKIRKENFRNGELIITILKTKEHTNIPLNDYAKEILFRNNFHLPMISNQKSNEYLKELLKHCEIDTLVKVTRFRGSERLEEIKPKYQLISTHTARRTFVTLCLEKGLRPEVVMSITGHKNYKNFKKYIQLTDKVKISELKRVWTKPNEVVLLAV